MDELKKYLQSQRDQLGSEEPSPSVWGAINEAVEMKEHVDTNEADAGEDLVQSPAKVVHMNFITRFVVAASVILLAGIGIWQVYQPSKNSTPLVKQHPSKKNLSSPVEQNMIDTISKTITAAITTPEKRQPEQRRTFPSATPITTIHTVNELTQADETKMEMMEASFTQVINLQKARISSTPLYAESPSYFKDFTLQMHQMEKDEKQIKIDIRKNGMSDELLDQLINVYQQKLNMLKLLQTEMQKLNTRYKQNRVAVDTVKTYYLNL
jgi:hypothetical protein